MACIPESEASEHREPVDSSAPSADSGQNDKSHLKVPDRVRLSRVRLVRNSENRSESLLPFSRAGTLYSLKWRK